MKTLNRLLALVSGYKIGLLATAASILIYAVGIHFFQFIDLKAFDFHMLKRGRVAPGNNVVIVAIDEKSLDAFGRWPWPRRRIAELVERLDSYGASVAAFDIVFSEPDDSSGLSAVRRLKKSLAGAAPGASRILDKAERDADNDAFLAGALAKSPSAILGYFFFTSGEDIKFRKERGGKEVNDYLIPSRFATVRNIGKGSAAPYILNAAGVARNIPPIEKAAGSFGYFNIVPDADGTVRWAPLVIEYRGALYPHLSLEAVRKFAGDAPLILNVAEYGVDSVNIGDFNLPTDESGRLLINFRGPDRTFPYYSFSDVVEGKAPPEAFKDKIVLVGATATGIYDMRVTPFSGTFPGIEVHANIIDTILQGDFIQRPDWVALFDVLSIIIPGVILSFVIPRVRAVYTTLLTVALVGMYIMANDYVFNRFRIWLTDIYPVFTVLFVSISVTTYQFITEEKKRREVKEAFSHYVSPDVVNRIIRTPDALSLGGEEKRLTVLFSDLRGFTTITEGLTPQKLVKLINDYLTPMTDLIMEQQGTVDKYMGDAIMAFWGAPLEQPDHPVRACRAALAMLKRLEEVQNGWKRTDIPRLAVGVGLSTGKVVVGNMGSSTRFDYTVMGDTVNLGSRLEGLNKEYGTSIIVPKYTYEDAKGHFAFRELDFVRVKGKAIPIRIYELMGEKGDERLERIAAVFEDGLKHYRARQWDSSERLFREVLGISPDDHPSKVFIGRINTLRNAEVPDDWDGVYVMKSK